MNYKIYHEYQEYQNYRACLLFMPYLKKQWLDKHLRSLDVPMRN